jgi:predicted RNase H-like HicB family nuclease
MITEYIESALKNAKYEILEEDNSVYGEIPNCPGVLANAENFEECRAELKETLEEWIILRLRKNLEIPVINNINLNITEIADASI